MFNFKSMLISNSIKFYMLIIHSPHSHCVNINVKCICSLLPNFDYILNLSGERMKNKPTEYLTYWDHCVSTVYILQNKTYSQL